MNTDGHHSVAEAAGIPVLENIFGKDHRSINALYLGNWLTDVSQAVDPVAFASASGTAKDAIQQSVDAMKNSAKEMLDEIIATTYDWAGETIGTRTELYLKPLKGSLDEYADDASEELSKAIDFFVAVRSNERDSRLAEFLRSAFLVVGYFKFVHQNAPGQTPPMDFECFMRVFGRPNDTRGTSNQNPAIDRPGAYTQYYPFEHLDRPEILPSRTPPIFAPGYQPRERPFRVAKGKHSGTRSPRHTKRIEPDMYSYLRDDMEMVAGILAEVDLEFEKAFEEYGTDVPQDSADWNITLAKLGHALHHVEDFFAHSNWIELAAVSMGPDFLAKAVPPDAPLAFMNRFNTVFHKRLKRYVTEPYFNWRNHPVENWIVTGYFDFRDTLISMAHIMEELWGGHVPDPWAALHDLNELAKEKIQGPHTIVHDAARTMRWTMDFITDPQKALDDRDNKVAQYLKGEFGTDVKQLRRPPVSRKVAEKVAQETSFLRKAPPEVQKAFFDVIVEGTRRSRAAKVTLSIYQAISQITEFVQNPIGWLKEWLPGWLEDKVEDAIKFYTKERVYDWLGAGRIGCHSLMAKDHGLEPFYKYQKECATAVHWYIVSTLTRWWTADEHPEYIDWLELIEYFLRNPLPPEESAREVKCDLMVTLIHHIEGGEQLSRQDKNRRYSLVHRYKPTAMKGYDFTWRTIADANFGTYNLPEKKAQQVINQILKDLGGIPVTPPNYAFKTGMRVLIPNQTLRAVCLVPTTEDDPPWFREVLKKDWTVFTGYEDDVTQESVAPLQHHTPRTIESGELTKLIQRGKMLRRQAREVYRPR